MILVSKAHSRPLELRPAKPGKSTKRPATRQARQRGVCRRLDRRRSCLHRSDAHGGGFPTRICHRLCRRHLLRPGDVGERLERIARRAADLFLAFRAIAIPAAGFVAMMTFVPELWGFYLVRLFVVSVATGNAVRFWLAIRGAGGDARKLVTQDIADNEIDWENE